MQLLLTREKFLQFLVLVTFVMCIALGDQTDSKETKVDAISLIKSKISGLTSNPVTRKYFTGALLGTAIATAVQPFKNAKDHFLSSRRGIFIAIKDIAHEDGVLSLFKGITLSLLLFVPLTSVITGNFEVIKAKGLELLKLFEKKPLTPEEIERQALEAKAKADKLKAEKEAAKLKAEKEAAEVKAKAEKVKADQESAVAKAKAEKEAVAKAQENKLAQEAKDKEDQARMQAAAVAEAARVKAEHDAEAAAAAAEIAQPAADEPASIKAAEVEADLAPPEEVPAPDTPAETVAEAVPEEASLEPVEV